jgi:hypothetical protein
MGLGSGIRDQGSGKKPIPDPGPGSKRHRIPDPDPQHYLYDIKIERRYVPFSVIHPETFPRSRLS